MRKYIYISLGGALGAVLRFAIENVSIWNYYGGVPLNNFLINTLGCFVLGLFLTAAYEFLEMDPDVRLGVATGLIGAFTTFSTLCKETFGLLVTGAYVPAIMYMILSALAGLAAVYLGNVAAREVVLKLTKSGIEFDMDDGEA